VVVRYPGQSSPETRAARRATAPAATSIDLQRPPPKGEANSSAASVFRVRDDRDCLNLLGVIRTLQDETGVHLEIRAVTEAARGARE